jgi:cell division protein FtsL
MQKRNNKIDVREINWEKIGIYIIGVSTFFTVIFYVIDMKVDIAKLQIQVHHLESRMK